MFPFKILERKGEAEVYNIDSTVFKGYIHVEKYWKAPHESGITYLTTEVINIF